MASTTTLTVVAAKIAATLTNYPAYVDLSDMTTEFWADVVNGGGDIRCYSDVGLTTELAREIVSCDTATDTGEMHVKVTSLTTTAVVYVTTDGSSSEPASTATYGRNNVWSDYVGVYHLESLTLDSTGNGYTLTNNNTVANIASQIGDGADFTATNTNKTLTNATNFGMGTGTDITMQTWFSPYDVTDALEGITFFNNSTRDIKVGFFQDNGTISFRVERMFVNSDYHSYTHGMSDGDWAMLHMTWDNTNKISYFNGGSVDNSTYSGNGSGTTGSNFTIGSEQNAGGTVRLWGSNKVDETRVRLGILSADWITTEYNNQSAVGAFWTIADAGGGGGAATNPLALANF